MHTIAKLLAGTIAAGAMAASSVSPAIARDHRGDGIGAGEVIAGAVVLGGIAAVAAAASDNDRYDRGYGNDGYRYDDRYGRYDHYDQRDRRDWGRGRARAAVAQCVNAAERTASRYSYGRADVTDIRSVRETRYGYEVRGRIAVNSMGRGWRLGDSTYGRGWDGDYRGWNSNLRGYDAGRFECRVERGRVVDLDFTGIRGLR